MALDIDGVFLLTTSRLCFQRLKLKMESDGQASGAQEGLRRVGRGQALRSDTSPTPV